MAGPGDVARNSGELLDYLMSLCVCMLFFLIVKCLYYSQSFRSIALNNIGIPAHEFVIP